MRKEEELLEKKPIQFHIEKILFSLIVKSVKRVSRHSKPGWMEREIDQTLKLSGDEFKQEVKNKFASRKMRNAVKELKAQIT